MEGDPDVDMQAYNTFFAEGEKLEKANSTEQAIKFYSKALNAITPNGIMGSPVGRHCLCSRSRCHLVLGDHEAALADAEAALADDPKFVKGLYAKAEALYFKGDFEYALMFYHRGKQVRPEMENFRLGIQKAQEAIDNSVGTPQRCQLEASGDLSIFLQHDAEKNAKKKGRDKRTTTRSKKSKVSTKPASDRTVKQLLGELYADHEYLKELMADPTLTTGSPEVKSLVSNELEYLDKRTEFWRQQKPIYARVNEAKEKTMRMSMRGTRGKPLHRNEHPKGRGKGQREFVLKALEEIDQSLEQNESEKALTQSKSLLKALEGMHISQADKMRADVYSAMGTAHLDRDELDQAMECHQKDLAIAKRIKNEEAEGRALANTGRVYARQGNYNKAIEAWMLKVPMKATPEESAWLYHEIGRCHIELGDCSSALEYGQKSLACASEAEDNRWKLNANVLIAQAQAKDGDLQEAVANFEQAKVLAEGLSDERAGEAVEKALGEVRDRMVTSGVAESDLTEEA